MPKRSTITLLTAAVAVLAIGGVAAGISLAGSAGSSEKTVVTFRLWDDKVADSYEASFLEFEKQHPDIDVRVNLIPWADYWNKLRTDVAGDGIDDIFWVNSSNFGAYVDQGKFLNIDEALGSEAKMAWDPSVVDQFTRSGALWGVPQLSDPGIGLIYNQDLLDVAGITPADLAGLRWDPTGSTDTLLPILKKLTKDSAGNTADDPAFDPAKTVQYGYNAANDLDAIYVNYLGSNAAALQSGEEFVFDTPQGQEAFQYLVDLINTDRVSPSAADTNGNSDFSRDQFTRGKMALFQTGVYNLAQVKDAAQFEWGIAPLPAGPSGAISVTNGIIAAAKADSQHPAAVKEVLEWVGSPEGADFIGKAGTATPAVTASQAGYREFWSAQGIDISPLFEVLKNGTVQAPQGAKFGEASKAFTPIFDEIFIGRTPVPEGLRAAQEAANAAIGDQR